MRFDLIRSGRALLVAAPALLSPTVLAETVNTTAQVTTSLREYTSGVAGSSAAQTLSFPNPIASLPLQAIARLQSQIGGGPSAAAAAAQFADPNTSDQPNPQEFALNISLNSVSPTETFVAQATGHEERRLVYRAGELSASSADGDKVDLVGRLFLDGALAILAVEANRDLTGSAVIVTVRVTKQVSGQDDQVLFDGVLNLSGATDGTVNVSADGGFPTRSLLLNDLSVISSQYSTFRVLIIPSIQINYSYSATVGEEFTLVADVTLDAQNVPRNGGIAAVLGTPTDALGDVIGLTNGKAVADETLALIAQARSDRSGEPAFPQAAGALQLCGAFGFELAAGFMALSLVKLSRCRR